MFQNSDDLLVASAECPSDDEDLEECEPGTGKCEGKRPTLIWLSRRAQAPEPLGTHTLALTPLYKQPLINSYWIPVGSV